MRTFRIFIASPGDVHQERDIVSIVVEELRRILRDIFQYEIELETMRWETHSWPDIGEDPQDVINQQIGEFDLLVGIMWKRFGTPTKRALSGTGEEFNRAYEYYKAYQRPRIMFYFRTTPFYTTDLEEIDQFNRVIQFRHKLETELGTFFWQYNDTLEFERSVREHLLRQIVQLMREKDIKAGELEIGEVPVHSPRLFLSYAREDTDKVTEIYYDLVAAGFSPWLDAIDILPGERWEMSIRKAIESADFFIVFMSEKSISKRGFVQKEIQMGLEIYETYLASDISGSIGFCGRSSSQHTMKR
jgi:hypothetical protein